MGKDLNHLSWDQYFIGVAQLSALRSKDPGTKVGAVIVDQDQKIVGIGYNGFPLHLSDDVFPWDKTGEPLETKYPYVVHAEVNAILNASTNLKGCKIYVTLFPCNECAKVIIQSGLDEVVFVENKYEQDWSFIASEKMFKAAKIKLRQVKPLTLEYQQLIK